MTFDIIAGVIITVVALSLIIFLTIRNRRIIERIHSRRSRTIAQKKRNPVMNDPEVPPPKIAKTLSRDLSLLHITMMGVGMMIGAGVFLDIHKYKGINIRQKFGYAIQFSY